MTVDLSACIQRFASNAQAIRWIIDGLDETLAHRRPDPDRWSIVEILGHLADEEREDFRLRLDLTLHHPNEPWPALDPRRRVADLDFNGRPLPTALDDFLAERRRSIEWLASLQDPAWDQGRNHPSAGRLTAGDLLASWLAHDLLHIRQLARTLWHHIGLLAPDRRVDYAGPAPT